MVTSQDMDEYANALTIVILDVPGSAIYSSFTQIPDFDYPDYAYHAPEGRVVQLDTEESAAGIFIRLIRRAGDFK